MNALAILYWKFVRLFWRLRRQPDLANWCTDQIVRLREEAWGMRPLGAVRTVGILATPHTLYVAHLLAYSLGRLGVEARIMTERPAGPLDRDMYFVVCPQMFTGLPLSRCIVFQMEQTISPRWFTRRYFKLLRGARAILEYSQRNLAFLEQRGIPYRKVYYLPIGSLPDYPRFLERLGAPAEPAEPACDVLFYGDASCARRQRLLQAIGARFKVRVVSGVFGAAVHRHIRSARVVVNLHYYDDALLETTRIHECLSLGATVVSEEGSDQDEHESLRGAVAFVPVGDAAALIAAIERALAAPGGASDAAASASHDRFHFMFCRMMLGLGFIDYATFARASGPLPIALENGVCISLPETAQRRAAARASPRPVALFDGLRADKSWVGCALSFKYLGQKACEAGLAQLEICEDDAELAVDFANRRAIVARYLGERCGRWDVFSGLIAHLHPEAQVLSVEECDGETFVILDRMTSTVLNIYTRRALALMAAWNPADLAPSTNTIDRYLERLPGLRIVTTIPFLVGHREDVHSSLWNFPNRHYRTLIAESERRLAEKVREFRSRSLSE